MEHGRRAVWLFCLFLLASVFEAFEAEQVYPTREVMPQIIKATDAKRAW